MAKNKETPPSERNAKIRADIKAANKAHKKLPPAPLPKVNQMPDEEPLDDDTKAKHAIMAELQKTVSEDRFWTLRGQSIQAYANVEQAICRLLAVLGNMTPFVAAAIFFKVSNCRARMDILEKLLKNTHGSKYSSFWNSLRTLVSQADETRNEIVHWHFSLSIADNGTPIVKLTRPNFWDSAPDAKFIAKENLIEFMRKTLFVAQLFDMFSSCLEEKLPGTPEQVQTWRDIFGKPTTYPPQSDHPLSQTSIKF